MSTLDAALAWAARGFRVFPITPGDKVPPAKLAWKTEATTDPERIRAWFASEPNYNYGVATGNGTLVVDVDANKNGYAALLDLDLPETLTVRTPGGGAHLYYSAPDVQNSVDRIAPGIDVRSAGGYVIGPGSHFGDPGGKKGYTGRYRIEAEGPCAEAPEGFVLRCGEPKQRDNRAAISIDDPDDIAFAVRYLQHDAPAAIEGRGGNNTTYAVAARLNEIGVSAELAVDLLLEHWNDRCVPPWDKEELATICRNASNYGQARQGSGGISALAAEFGGALVLPPAAPMSAAGKFDKVFSRREMTPIEALPRRAWVAHRLLMRDEATILAGPGGVGKSGFSQALAAHGAVCRSFAGYDIHKPFKTIVYNLEDSRHEMEARMYATCATYGLDPREVEKSVLLWPGRELRFRLMNRDHTVAMADVQELARLTKREGFDVIILDPIVSLHHEDENDNTAMGEVMEALNGLARLAGAAVLGLHHTPKGVRQAGSSDAVRGAGNIVNSVRIASTIYAADENDAMLYGFGEDYRGRYIRIDDAKQNASPLGVKPAWLEKWSYPLPNGDTVQALRPVELSATAAGEAKLIATVLAAHMAHYGTAHLHTHDAAKVLVEAEAAFRERLPPSGNLAQTKALIEMRLSTAIKTDAGVSLVVRAKTEKDKASATRFVTVA
jgi:hypothetical protein